MTPIDYTSILQQAFAEYGALILHRQELEFEIAKKNQFIRATMNMLPDEERAKFETALNNLAGASLGLTDAIRKVLQTEPKKSFTATQVRDKLKASNFDFSSYKTNPLASIHAVLKRLKPEEVDTTDIDGVTAWRWVGEVSVAPHGTASFWLGDIDEPSKRVWNEAFAALSEKQIEAKKKRELETKYLKQTKAGKA